MTPLPAHLIDSCLRKGERLLSHSLLEYSDSLRKIDQFAATLPEPINAVVERRLHGQPLVEIARELSLTQATVEAYLEWGVKLIEAELAAKG